MNKITKFIKNNYKLFIGIIIGTLLSGGTVYAAIVLSSSEVSYTNNSQSTVQGALDNLYTKANTWIDPDYIDFTNINVNKGKTMVASGKGLCLQINGTVWCFKTNNYNVEQNRVRQAFQSSPNFYKCFDGTGHCYSSEYDCNIVDDGRVICSDSVNGGTCWAFNNNTAQCS